MASAVCRSHTPSMKIISLKRIVENGLGIVRELRATQKLAGPTSGSPTIHELSGGIQGSCVLRTKTI